MKKSNKCAAAINEQKLCAPEKGVGKDLPPQGCLLNEWCYVLASKSLPLPKTTLERVSGPTLLASPIENHLTVTKKQNSTVDATCGVDILVTLIFQPPMC